MNLRNKWKMGLLSLGTVLVVGVSAGTVYAQTATPEQPAVADPQRLQRGEDHSAILAEVLGITQEELQAAVTRAREAAIAQAVADGRITQEQADQMLQEGAGRGWGPLGRGADHDAELAEALGITLEELQAAKAEVKDRVLVDAVASGEITQEEADLMAAREALHEYLREQMQTSYEAAIAQAVADGVITQAQADQLLSEEGQGFFGPGGGRPHGGRGDAPMGGPNGGPRGGPNDSPLPPESETPESSDSSTVPSSNTNL
jgi:hypothetical protein